MFNHIVRSMSARLWITAVAALAVTLSLVATVAMVAFNDYPEALLGRHEQMEHISEVANGLIFDAAGRPESVRLTGETAWLFHVVTSELRYRVLDSAGTPLLWSQNGQQDVAWGDLDMPKCSGRAQRVVLGGEPFDVMTLQVSHGSQNYYVQTATSARFIAAIIGDKIKPIPAIVKITIFIAMVTFALTLTVTVYRVMRPLREASRAAALISPRNLKTRLSIDGIPSEIAPLIDAFNAALERLENGFAVQQQFLASAAHELQTPLTLIRGEIEMQPDILAKDRLLRDIDQMARQVRQLLHLAEVSESQNFTFGEVNTVDVAQDVIDYLSRKADARQVRLRLYSGNAVPPIWADRSALFVLLKNIMENAINVTPAHSTVSVLVDSVSIDVRDEGPGIKKEYLPFLFKRFWRAPDAKHDGAGLGLAICKEIAVAHEWHLTVSSLASGTSFMLRF
ncbi:HAMP domain-containing histidine kinase (plasmid) [Paraburkholderia sp. D15]|uniref:sensor histidine kinase n=1 Tax=Paraburkholderia sp. D15 TaxID=2880218 RepID=UPI002478E85C|nr:ATP-binding protein [Paraburkholderia sp. D15]WGS54888.1 HAMP domain-containing histidine kinase [Paraburkholderia sp. D15]